MAFPRFFFFSARAGDLHVASTCKNASNLYCEFRKIYRIDLSYLFRINVKENCDIVVHVPYPFCICLQNIVYSNGCNYKFSGRCNVKVKRNFIGLPKKPIPTAVIGANILTFLDTH